MLRSFLNWVTGLFSNKRHSELMARELPMQHGAHSITVYDPDEVQRLAAEVQNRLDRVLDYNEELYRRAEALAAKSRQMRASIYESK